MCTSVRLANWTIAMSRREEAQPFNGRGDEEEDYETDEETVTGQTTPRDTFSEVAAEVRKDRKSTSLLNPPELPNGTMPNVSE